MIGFSGNRVGFPAGPRSGRVIRGPVEECAGRQGTGYCHGGFKGAKEDQQSPVRDVRSY